MYDRSRSKRYETTSVKSEHGAAPETVDRLVPYLQALVVLPVAIVLVVEPAGAAVRAWLVSE